MANTEDTFDPNDLESIDALLDEAELEAATEDESIEPQAVKADESWDNLPEVDDESLPAEAGADAADIADDTSQEEVAADDDDILSALDDLEETSDATLADVEPIEEVVENTEPEVVAVSEPLASNKNKPQQNLQQAVEEDKAVDDFLEKRAQASSKNNANLSVKEMESIKKLVLIFGSVLSVLVIVAIGIGVWSALAASSAGVDEETKTLIESIKVATEQNGGAISENDKLVESVEKKLDAINFQIEQVMTDLAEMGQPKKEDVIDPLGLGVATKEPAPVKTAAAPVVAAATSPEMMEKLSAVSSRLYRAQKRIDEINQRLKAMQSQSSSLSQSMKMLEKEALLNQAQRAEKAEEMKKQQKQRDENPYNYSAPDGGFYDQSVSDSYP